jgi:glutamate-ammonia-ligase adenylyltransferase
VPGGAFTAVAFGKVGGREMTVTSDLDLIFLWDAPEKIESSDGAKPLHVNVYYQRLAQRLINAISAPTGEGKLYELDLRLRPSGAKGPLATNLDGFVTYQRDNAWTWEHLALTRARPITGDATFQARVREAIRTVLTRPRDAQKLTAEVADMRALMAREHPATLPWDIKQWRGGLIDVEFIAQYLQLRHAAAKPGILATNTASALLRTVEDGILPADQGQCLQDALRLWQTVQGLIRLTYEGEFDPATASAGLKTALARASNEVDFAALEAKMRERSSQVLAIFNTLIPPAQS